MLDLSQMTQGDALHALEVYRYLTEHFQEITAIAQDPTRAGVSAADAQSTFYTEHTELSCTRFLPITIALCTEQGEGATVVPIVSLYPPTERHMFMTVDSLRTQNLHVVTELLGISGNEKTWCRGEKTNEQEDRL